MSNVGNKNTGYALYETDLEREIDVGRSTGQQPRTKSASFPAVKPFLNCWPNTKFVITFGLYRISLVRASGETLMQYFSIGQRLCSR